MAQHGQPVLRMLDRPGIERILSRNSVGRIAFAFHDRVDVEPINYVYADGWIYGRTSTGAKLGTIAHNRFVAFEVDETRGLFDWSSVVVKGAFYELSPDASPQEREVWEKGVELLRQLLPETLTTDDPVPFRQTLFRISARTATGREAVQAEAAEGAKVRPGEALDEDGGTTGAD